MNPPISSESVVTRAQGPLWIVTISRREARNAVNLAVTAQEAQAAGLLNRLVEEGGALAAACELALEIAANAPLAVAASKQVVLQSRCWGEEEMFARQQPLVDGIGASDDAQEGARAFAEKRKPVWQGR